MKKILISLFMTSMSCTLSLEEGDKELPSRPSQEISAESLNESHVAEVNLLKAKAVSTPETAYFRIIDKNFKGKDNTSKFLKVLEHSDCEWEIYAVENSDKRTENKLANQIIGIRFQYYIKNSKSLKHHYIKDSTTVQVKFPDGSSSTIENKIKLRPVKGKSPVQHPKTKYTKHLKYLLAHGNLGVRNGCYINLDFISPEKEKHQNFNIKEIFGEKDSENVYIKLSKQGESTVIYLKSIMDKPPISHVHSPKFILNNSKGLSKLKKRGLYAATVAEGAGVGSFIAGYSIVTGGLGLIPIALCGVILASS